MKWFKHEAKARNDERISKLEDKASLEGYGFYFKMLEIVAENMDSSDRCEMTYSLSRWGRQLNITSKKFIFLLQCCVDVGLMSAQRSDDDITVIIPNLLKYRDNHTKNLQATSKQELELELDKEVELKKPKTIVRSATARFQEFWDLYPKTPRKVGKSPCQKKWKAKKLDEHADVIIEHVKAMSLTKQWIDGFEPSPITYLNQNRWLDEVIAGSTASLKTPWFLTAGGIEAKGAELNLPILKGEIFPNYRLRIFKVAGLTTEQYHKAKQDFDSKK